MSGSHDDHHSSHDSHTEHAASTHSEHEAAHEEHSSVPSMPTITSLSPVVDALIKIFEEGINEHGDPNKYQVSRTVSLLAALYEKARNAVEFRADHLIRRAAIERILKRRILLGGSTNSMGENLIVELLWARYLDSSQISDTKVSAVQTIIDKYLVAKYALFDSGKKDVHMTWETLLGILSAEIEEVLVPAKKREALNNFFYQAILSKVKIPGEEEKTTNILTYIAIEKAFAQSDEPLIVFHLLRLIQPSWLEAHPNTINQELPEFLENIALIEKSLKHPLSERLYRYVRKNNPPFLLFRDFLFDRSRGGSHARSIIMNEQDLERNLTDLATRRYLEIGTKVRRAVVRSIIYIFLTKMVFALALEAPVDLFITKKLDYLALAINSIFPPILLFIITGFLRVPGEENTARLIGKIKHVLYEFDDLKNDTDVFMVSEQSRRPVLTAIFSFFYIAAFVISFGFISYVLTKLDFNPASQIIFIFFVTLVSFFAYRIRLSAIEYEVVERHGALSPIIDVFFLPILRVGSALSSGIAKLNVIMFVFDFILEAPLKVIFEFMEEWFRFIRSKKDEIL